jgi:hypothetical protein
MTYLKVMLAVCWIMVSITSCSSSQEGNTMFIQAVDKLIQAKDADSEEVSLGELLTIARKTDVNYGYRVFNKTQSKRVMPDELSGELDDELVVTIFVGEEAPYQEFEWKPKYNDHITRLIMP